MPGLPGNDQHSGEMLTSSLLATCQIDDLQIDMLNRRKASRLDDMDKRLQRICDLNALS